MNLMFRKLEHDEMVEHVWHKTVCVTKHSWRIQQIQRLWK